MKARKLTRMKDEPKLRTFAEVAQLMAERHGWKVSAVRVRQICSRAERKIALQLDGWDG